jgi:hypothetical protein
MYIKIMKSSQNKYFLRVFLKNHTDWDIWFEGWKLKISKGKGY